tara:strand:+ start:14460 stop:16148 length:1689 start_codon:yes stop_codon:yes gene_type:complete
VLESLKVQNLALLESQDLTFDEGFTVITGESGSGKSIVFDCLDALLGGGNTTSNGRLLSSGNDFFLIEGVFSLTPLLQKWLKSHSIYDDDEQLIISREWRVKEDRIKSRCRINGTHVNLSQVMEVRPLLIDFTFQGQSSNLNSSEWQLEAIDRLLGASSSNILNDLKIAWFNWNKSYNILLETKLKYKNIKIEQNQLLEVFTELNDANLEDPEEQEKLKLERDRLLNDVYLTDGIGKIINIFKDGNDHEKSIVDQISICIDELNKMEKFDSTLNEKTEKAFEILHSSNDLLRSFEEYNILLQSQPDRLNEIQERLYHLQSLQKKYFLSLPELIKKRNDISNLICLDDIENRLVDLESIEKLSRKIRDEISQTLSDKRKEIAHNFEKKLIELLSRLGFSNIRFSIEFKTTSPKAKGIDEIKFLFSANPGQPMLPLSEIASGGEISRFLLAIKIILLSVETPTTLVFDEIDAGVSGRISKSISMLLRDLSSKHQVFCVTHQPLVAANAQHHFSVSKKVFNGKTCSIVKVLKNFSDRQKELAELAGGDLEEANIYAASLLEQQAA